MNHISNHKSALERAKSEDLKLPSNCFEIGRFGTLSKCIVLKTDKGPDELRPWQPYIPVGKFRFHRDFWNDKEKGPLGCVYHHKDGVAFVHRAILHEVHQNDSCILRRAGCDETIPVLVKANALIPNNGVMYSEDGKHILRIHAGAYGAHVVKDCNGEALVSLDEGDVANILFADGFVRRFKRFGSELIEKELSLKDMVKVRVEDAHERLELARLDHNEKWTFSVLSGMANLVDATRFIKKDGQNVRRFILSEFFLSISEKELNQIHRKLLAILYSIDSALVSMLKGVHENKSFVDTSILLNNKQSFRVIEGGKKKMTPAQIRVKKSERSERDRQDRLKRRGPSGGSSKIQSKK